MGLRLGRREERVINCLEESYLSPSQIVKHLSAGLVPYSRGW